MSTVHVKIVINAPVEQVWETIMDPNRLADWVTIHRSVTNISSDPTSKGATMDQMLHMRGFPFRVHWTLVEVQAPRHAEWDGRGPAHSRARITYDLKQDGQGATEFDYSNEFTPPGGRLGNVASRVIVGAASEREANSSLQRLKALLEKG
jgi:uncharacterized protein YndB with AHSA1/START domain